LFDELYSCVMNCAGVTLVSVVNDQWCWKAKSINVEVVDSDLPSVDFTQTGFMLSASLSHSILLVCTLSVLCTSCSNRSCCNVSDDSIKANFL